MGDPLKVLFISSEVEPYAKTGGLADVTAALPKALRGLGVDVRTVLPLYSYIDLQPYALKEIIPACTINMNRQRETFAVYHTRIPYGVDTYFIYLEKYYGRSGFYNDSKGDYPDNAFRFAFLCRAALETAKALNFKPDIIHLHDWQTTLTAYYLKKKADPFFANTRTVLTLHNMGYQGVYSPEVLEYAGIEPEDFNGDGFESYGNINLLKGGIIYADALTTVSPTYAQEILNPDFSGGLHKYLERRKSDLKGILNGVDTDIWNPATDSYISYNYSVENYREGKKYNKRRLQEAMGLASLEDMALIAYIGRFAEQKGLHLLRQTVDHLMGNQSCQLVVLGSGDPELERFFGDLSVKYTGRVGTYAGYSEPLAHLMEAGADVFIMPSLYEPCGLNQMYSQIYGTLPVVRAVGGLEDTVQPYNRLTGEGTGFKFGPAEPEAFYNTLREALNTFYDRPLHWDTMVRRAMECDYSWKNSAANYLQLYSFLSSW